MASEGYGEHESYDDYMNYHSEHGSFHDPANAEGVHATISHKVGSVGVAILMGGQIFLCIILSLAISVLLYTAAELAEEYAREARIILMACLAVEGVLHFLLLCFESYGFFNFVIFAAAHFCYYKVVSRFPVLELLNLWGFLSLVGLGSHAYCVHRWTQEHMDATGHLPFVLFVAS